MIDQHGKQVEIEVLGIDKISSEITGIDCQSVAKLFKLEEKDLNRPNSGEIDILIGLQQFGFHPVKCEAKGHLLLMKNRFGFAIAGTHEKIQEKIQIQESCSLVKNATVMHISESIGRFFNIESLGVMCQPRCGACRCGKCNPGGDGMTLRDEKEFKVIESGIKFDEQEKRWIASYPWIQNPKELPNSRRFALAMMHSTEKRISRNEIHKELYNNQMQDMVDRRVSREVTAEEIDSYQGPKYYVTHHAVIKPSSKSTPCRIVFNSSAKYGGSSLNDFLAKGPSLLNTIFGILLRWRQYKIGFIGDISKMYHSIGIPYEDQMTHLYFWRNCEDKEDPKTFAITAVNMGDRPSACIAQICLKKTAEEIKESYPESAEILLNNSYMDDVPGSANTEQDAKSRMTEIETILLEKGFKMKEWIFSGQKQNSSITENQTRARQVVGIDDQIGSDAGSVLGMQWDTERDMIKFETNGVVGQIPTKRSILSTANSFFDPLGIITPLTVKAKIILRKVWAHIPKIGWDDEIPHTVENDWNEFKNDIPNISSIQITRSLTPIEQTIGRPTLVIFSDGSKEAYGAVAYIRWKTADGFTSILVAAKSRVTPIKTIDIVRIELCGAVIGTRIRNTIQTELDIEFERIIHLVDSEIVHAMVYKDSYGFGTFIANRIGEIQQTTQAEEWCWVEGKQNVADLTTRGCKAAQLNNESTWINGPEFLKSEVDEWPVRWKVRRDIELPELKQSSHVIDVAKTEAETLASRFRLERFSRWRLLVYTTARILLLYRRFAAINKVDNILTPLLIQNAEKLWIMEAQRNLDVTQMKNLRPVVEDGLIYVGGRAERWMSGTWNRQKFLLLPKDGEISLLIARYMHCKGGHLGMEATISKIRSRYWIIGIRKIVKNVITSCRKCKEKLKISQKQIMSPLPVERLKPAPAFFNVGVDYFGPYQVKGEVQKRVTGKCYGVLFVCLSSRAIFADIANDYSTEGFLHVLRRFSSIRGWPKKFISDQGTQLVGACNELRDIISKVDWKIIQECGNDNGCEWSFSPANAPWYNGATESLVKCTKRALNAATSGQVMKFSELQTVLYESAQLVNQRPIGRHPTHPDEESYLCPNDLILGRATPDVPQFSMEENPTSCRRFNFTQSVISAFWKRWTREVFPNLILQPKWHTAEKNLEDGDVVLVEDHNLMRGKWKLAVVNEAYASNDGRVRKVKLRCRSEAGMIVEIDRPVQKLILLVPSEQNQ